MEMRRLAPGHDVRALVVDDVAENRDVLSTMLRMAGCQAVASGSAVEALGSIAGFQPDIVFLDLRLRGEDGLEAVRRLAEATGPARPRIVATSASVLAGERERSLAAGCDEFLPKPFRVEEICACLEALLHVQFTLAAGEASAREMTAADLARIALPEELMIRMHRAAELHSATALKRCLAEIEDDQPGARAFAEHLRPYLDAYDMEHIQRVLAAVSAASVQGNQV